ncbi:MAG TPA: alpha/beta fold hydrolase [Egicoccus sp.]|nr:alpha/beta fold hydrolase [Egicoccus sp.]HSK23099.1 alpha/beta fold hydrolase [Egicoccus sp.]
MHHDDRRAHQPETDDGDEVVADDGCRLATRLSGPVDGEPVVLLHGGPGLPDYLGDLAALLDDRYRVHRYDQRGAGRSARRRPWTTARFLSDLEALRRAWGIERMHLVGHSWGAALGLRFALAHPRRVATLTYLSGVGLEWGLWKATFHSEHDSRLDPGQRQLARELAALEDPSVAQDAARLEVLLAADSLDPAPHAVAITRMARQLAEAGVNWQLNQELGPDLDADDADYRGLDVPVLVVHGRHDPRPAAAVASLVETLPRVHQVLLDGGHELWIDAPDELRTQIVRHMEVTRGPRW